jgi:hypothetical protein
MEYTDFGWLVDHGQELFEKYRGKWIAVHNEEVIGVGETATEAAAAARKKQPDGDFILEALDTEVDVIYGGLRLA